MRNALAAAVILVTSAATVLISAPAEAGPGAHPASTQRIAKCAAQFEDAQRADMVSFRDFDADTWRAGHDPAAVSIFPQGQRFVGINAIMDALAGHFADQEAVWSWTELGRHVYGCDSAIIEYDATYDIPSIGFHQRADTVVSYLYENHHWLSVMDQGTLLELTTGTDGTRSMVSPAARPGAHPAPSTSTARCAAQFEDAQRADMVSFRDFDADTWRAGHDPAAVSIFPQGQRFVGINAIMDALAGHFADQEAEWSWTELGRRVNGCESAFIEYDATYDIPSAGFHQRADTVVSYVYENHQWRSVFDQGTILELAS